MNTPIYPPYMGYTPVIAPQQQRLAEMEQRYAQMQAPLPQMTNFIKGRAVTSFDEAKASMIDLDGSLHVFTDIGNKKIYTKQINLDGTATLNTYVLESPEPTYMDEARREPESMPDFVRHEELETVCRALNDRISALCEQLDDLTRDIATPSKSSAAKGGAKK